MIPVMEDKGNGRVPPPKLSHRLSLFLVRLVVEDKGKGRVPHPPELSHCLSLFLVRPVMKDEGNGRVPHAPELSHCLSLFLVRPVMKDEGNGRVPTRPWTFTPSFVVPRETSDERRRRWQSSTHPWGSHRSAPSCQRSGSTGTDQHCSHCPLAGLSPECCSHSDGTWTCTQDLNNNNSDRKFIQRFQRLIAVYNLIQEKHATHKYPSTNQWYINQQTKNINKHNHTKHNETYRYTR